MNIDEVIKEIDFLSSEIGYMGIDSINDDYSAQQALHILKKRIEQKIPIHNVSDCSEQWHVLSANMGDGKCSRCGKKLTQLNYR